MSIDDTSMAHVLINLGGLLVVMELGPCMDHIILDDKGIPLWCQHCHQHGHNVNDCVLPMQKKSHKPSRANMVDGLGSDSYS